jgi:acyl-CoA reductase-like NAD-dependent aldehyde dehydrogenase
LLPASKYSENQAYGAWTEMSHADRCAIIYGVAAEIAEVADQLVESCRSAQRTDDVDTIASELIPLCDALVWIGSHGARVLKTRKLSICGRPLWLWGVHSHVRRDPLGRVLVLAAWNYPLLLAGVQTAQALAAGNVVLLKPAPGSEAACDELVQCFHRAGVPQECLRCLDSSPEAGVSAIREGVDMVVLTGGAATGRKVLAQAADSLTPCIMELSGCDAVVVLDGADTHRVGNAIRFGLSLNAGATCIGPRRLIVQASNADAVLDAVLSPWRESELPLLKVHPSARTHVAKVVERAILGGSKNLLDGFSAERLRTTGEMHPVVLDHVTPDDDIAKSDLFAPVLSVMRVHSVETAVSVVNNCPYRLAASVFGPPKDAQLVARRLRVGSVVINDLIAPTADARLPFGGRGQSGFGVTRGREGLLAMTTPVSISERRGRIAPHLSPRRGSDAETLLGSLQMIRGRGLSKRLAGLRRLLAAVKTGRR